MSRPRETNSFQRFFWLAFERSRNPMLVLDLDQSLVAVNPACEVAFGRHADEVIGRRAHQYVPSAWWNRMDHDWAKLVREGTVTADVDVLRPDRSRVRLQYAAVREYVTDRQLVLSVVCDFHPVSSNRSGDTHGTLTPREQEVVSRLAMGQRVHEIASDLYLSPATVQTHVRHAMAKLNARSQAQLVATALGNGLLDPELVTSLQFSVGSV